MLKAVLSSRLLFWFGLGTLSFILIIYSVINFASPKKFAGCIPSNSRDSFDPSQTAAIWQNQNIQPLLGLNNKLSLDKQKILGIQSQDKIIEISLTQKSLTARQGDQLILTTPINIGKYVETPVGEFSIYRKNFAIDLSGGSTLNQTQYYLPNVPFALYFSPQFALVGSYWSKSFGNHSGFGCIEVPISSAETLYYWADSPASSSSPGTKIIINL